MESKEKWTILAYVAGPYRAASEYLVKQNIRKAEDIGVLLWSYGFVAVVPHLNAPFFRGAYSLPDSVWLKGDMSIIKRYDIMVVIPGWQCSQGHQR